MNPGTLCFCEPLNETLEQITPSMIADLRPENSDLHHPVLDAPYFYEFHPLLNETGCGVKRYQIVFGLTSYFAISAEQPAGLAEYLQSLIDFARAQGRQPVLKFTRALGRAAWLKSCFPEAYQIALNRDPWSQFQSGYTLAHQHNNYSFLMIPLFAISRAQDGSLQLLCKKLSIADVSLSFGIDKCAHTYTLQAKQMSKSDLFSAFLGMFIASHAMSVDVVDLMVSQEALSDDSYRRNIESGIHTMTGVNVDLTCKAAAPANPKDELAFNVCVACEAVYAIMNEDYPKSVAYTRRRFQFQEYSSEVT